MSPKNLILQTVHVGSESTTMAIEQNEKNNMSSGPVKPFMTAGPGLHYSHSHVTTCWLGAMAVYVLACLFWSSIIAGSFMPFDLRAMLDPAQWRLERCTLDPLSIYEYPWQIVVLGLLMGMLSVMPPLTAQLLSFRYAVPFILLLAVFCNLPLFALFVLVSAAACACRPLRFRSRFIALSLCLAPQLFYWAYFGGIRNIDPIKWGFSFAPWVCAWIIALLFAGGALLVGHFNRYRPGLNLLMGTITLIAALSIFHNKIGFDELAFQQYVAKNNPEEIVQFHDHSLKDSLDRTFANDAAKKYFASLFYPSDAPSLRQRLKREIQSQIIHDRWPSWFAVTEELNFGPKRQWLLGRYDQFINKPRPSWLPEAVFKMFEHRRRRSRRMPIALYYKAMLSEISPDPVLVMDKEILRFYSDVPHWANLQVWYSLYSKFPESSESIEARRRIAYYLASQGLFEQADALAHDAQQMIENLLAQSDTAASTSTGILTAFSAPETTAVTTFKLVEMQRQLDRFHNLIDPAKLPADPASRNRLQEFLILDPHAIGYSASLDAILSQTPEEDALRDNLLLAKALLIKDWQAKSQELRHLYEKYRTTESGIAALFELGILKVRMWQELSPSTKPEIRLQSLKDARQTLQSFIALNPRSIYKTQVENIMQGLPVSE